MHQRYRLDLTVDHRALRDCDVHCTLHVMSEEIMKLMKSFKHNLPEIMYLWWHGGKEVHRGDWDGTGFKSKVRRSNRGFGD